MQTKSRMMNTTQNNIRLFSVIIFILFCYDSDDHFLHIDLCCELNETGLTHLCQVLVPPVLHDN